MNSVVHFELPAQDRERAKKFYSAVFGWQMMDFDPKNTMVSTTPTNEQGQPLNPGAINGGIYTPDKPTTPSIVIDVPNLEAHLKLVEANGGKKVDDVIEIPGMGRYLRFSDPEGNLVGMWQTVRTDQ